ncbi:hypothetical protein BKA70DRAFT_1318443 [Coprinopsis sp. MPI-PUGE-AT-0042]|nr:hypothetical protein BKA70DRAFT_1318443 [Coprinopsis sp. MPI-PUGE-AT-0042]
MTNAIIFIVSLLLCAFVAASPVPTGEPSVGGSPSPADAHRGDSAWLIVENRRDLGKDAVVATPADAHRGEPAWLIVEPRRAVGKGDALASRKDSAWLFHPVEPQSVGKEDTA